MALNVVNKAINTNNTLPVLNNILLKAEGKKLFFSATNLEIAISCSIDADVRSEGAITVPAKLITGYISLLSDDKVEVSTSDGGNLSINSTSSSTKIKCISADEFPLIPKVEKDQELVIPVNALHEAVTETVFAASTNTSRPVLSGVLLLVNGEFCKLVSTDSYRLAEKQVKLPQKAVKEAACVVPGRTMMELGKILAKTEEKEVKIVISKNQVLFSVGNVELISRLIEGKFPDYEKIIPKEQKSSFEVSVEDFSLVLKRVSLFARENNNSVKLSASSDGKLVVSSEETKVGEEKAELMIKMQGEDNKISLNSQYLLDVLTYITTDTVVFSLNDKVSPAMIRPVGSDDYLYIIMPLKV